jgi:hypothetical protein
MTQIENFRSVSTKQTTVFLGHNPQGEIANPLSDPTATKLCQDRGRKERQNERQTAKERVRWGFCKTGDQEEPPSPKRQQYVSSSTRSIWPMFLFGNVLQKLE